MSGRAHEHYCTACRGHYSPFDFDACPCGAPSTASFYDPNLANLDERDEVAELDGPERSEATAGSTAPAERRR